MTLYRPKIGGGEYDPISPESHVLIIETQCPAKGVVLPASAGSSDDRIDQELRKSSRSVILAGLGLTFRPQGEDILKTNEGFYRIAGATPLDPSGLGVIIWNIGSTLDLSLNPDTAGTGEVVLIDSETGLPITDTETDLPFKP